MEGKTNKQTETAVQQGSSRTRHPRNTGESLPKPELAPFHPLSLGEEWYEHIDTNELQERPVSLRISSERV